MTSTRREGLNGTLNARRTVATWMNLVQHLRRGDILAGSNLQLLPVQCRNALHGHLEVGLMARLLGIPAGQRVLQVGCGSGVALPHLSKLCKPRAMTGIDIDSTLLGEAEGRLREKGVSAHLARADVREMPFPGRSFDLVVDFGVCYHIGHPEDALAEIGRVLDTTGTFVYETPVAQVLAHPYAGRQRLPWEEEPALTPHRNQLIWASRKKGELRQLLTSHAGGQCYSRT